MEQLYRVVLSDQLRPGWTMEKSIAALAEIMGCEPEQAKKIIENAPQKIKHSMPLNSAQRYKNKLEQTGLVCAIQASFEAEDKMASEKDSSQWDDIVEQVLKNDSVS